MATPKRKENSLKKSKKNYEAKESLIPSRPRRVFEENMTRLQEVTNGSSNEQAAYMSLDVLAQVATDKLRDDLKLQPHVAPKKVSKRSIQCLEILNLEQIQSLTNKALLNFFSEMTCNEMTKNFTYQCYLMPEKCQHKVTSFGHETKAKINMQSHLNSHIEQLAQEANDPERQYKFIFTAEPIHVRNRKLSVKEAEKSRKKKSISTNNSPVNGSNATRVKNNKTFTALKSNKEISRENKAPAPKVLKTEKDIQLPKNCMPQQKASKISDPLVKYPAPKKNIPAPRYSKKQNPKDTQNCRKKITTKKSSYTENKTTQNTDCNGHATEFSDANVLEVNPYSRGNEHFTTELLYKNQPHLDHCYTSIHGKKSTVESESVDPQGDTDYPNNVHTCCIKKNYPILEIVAKWENGYMVASEEILGVNGKPKDPESDDDYEPTEAAKPVSCCEQNGNIAVVHCGQKPYPPMPKSELAKKGKINVPEEDEYYNDETEEVPTSKKKKKDTGKCTNEWERKIALRCIRELKNRKKDDKIPLVCQICVKRFTASATLMYHYRSHAGIKPFICVLCWTTFTRQHSLNYHMLIHNNQSRFTCGDCGRKFRHPSHFKEHLRRHTGETPFTCDDCEQKFKTRNTYKRHLKTRHGKLLTANGISSLSKEEFLKVRTKPYKKFNNIKENEQNAPVPSPDVSPNIVKCEQTYLPTTFTTTSTITTLASSTNVVTTTSSTYAVTPSTSTQNSVYVPIEIFVKH